MSRAAHRKIIPSQTLSKDDGSEATHAADSTEGVFIQHSPTRTCLFCAVGEVKLVVVSRDVLGTATLQTLTWEMTTSLQMCTKWPDVVRTWMKRAQCGPNGVDLPFLMNQQFATPMRPRCCLRLAFKRQVHGFNRMHANHCSKR